MSEDTQMDTSAEVVEEKDTSYSPSDEDTSEQTGEVSDTQPKADENQAEEERVTDKGTKLDENPQSALHQQLANERRARLELEERLKGLEQKPQETDQKPKQYVDINKLNTKEELASVLNYAFSVIDKQNNQIKEFGQRFQGSEEQRAEVANFQSFASEAQEVFKKFPELDEENKDRYNKALDEKLTKLYKKSAYDRSGRLLRNRPSFAEFATDYMEAVNSARQAGSSDANNRVVQKQIGQSVRTSKKSSVQDLSNLSPEEFIAKQMGL